MNTKRSRTYYSTDLFAAIGYILITLWLVYVTTRPIYVDIVRFGAHTPHNFVSRLKAHNSGWKMTLHLKGKSLVINTFPCASLRDVGFYRLQGSPFGSLQSPPPLMGKHGKRVGRVGLTRLWVGSGWPVYFKQTFFSLFF